MIKMNKNKKKWILSFGTLTTLSGTLLSVVACADYQPNNNDLSTRNFLSGEHAYNKALADYYLSVTNKMYSDKKNTLNVNVNNLRFDVYQWLINANAIKDPYYWGTQRNDWIKNGTFIDLKNPNLNTPQKNETFVQSLFKKDNYGNYILKNDIQTFKNLQGQTNGTPNAVDLGSGVIMDVNRQLYSIAYLLLTNKNDVENWVNGNPADPSKKGQGQIKTDEKNNGQYFFIDYLRNSKPFIMWKNEQKNPTSFVSFTGIDKSNADKFNNLATTLNPANSMSKSLTLYGPNGNSTTINDLATNFWSYLGLITNNPFTTGRHGDIDPHDPYMKGMTDASIATNGGKQGWVNQDGTINQNKGGPINMDATTIDYAYIQQLLPAWSNPGSSTNGVFTIPNWMTSDDSNNPGTAVKDVWNVAFQISFYSTNILSSAKNYWIHNGYSLKVFIPSLEDNLSKAHIFKP